MTLEMSSVFAEDFSHGSGLPVEQSDYVPTSNVASATLVGLRLFSVLGNQRSVVVKRDSFRQKGGKFAGRNS